VGLIRSSAAGWGSLEVIAAMLAGITLAVAFIAWERYAPSPIIHLGLFRAPGFASAVRRSVPPEETGVASGTNSTMRELGGVFDVAVLAAAFARPGVYSSAPAFVHGASTALWVGAGLSALGITAAAFTPGMKRHKESAANRVLALSGDPA
jgi:hypothetical protein